MNGDKDAADLAIDSNPWLVLPLDSDQQEETQDSCCEVSLLFILKLFVFACSRRQDGVNERCRARRASEKLVF